MVFALFIKNRLAMVGATQSDLARALSRHGVPTTRAAVSLWTNGERVPRYETLSMTLDLLGCLSNDVRVEAYDLAASSSTDNGAVLTASEAT